MSKYTDAIRDDIISAFNAGDQPTEAQFTNWITRIQEGIEEHQHDNTGDGDGAELDLWSLPYNSKGTHFATIQAAIDDLGAGGGWVFVPAGTWDERVTIAQNNITLYGTGWDSIINEAVDSGHAITITGDNVSIRDLSCLTTPGGGNAYHGIYVTGGNARLENILVNGSDEIGIYLVSGGANSVIKDCYIFGCDTHGIYFFQSEHVRCMSNKVKTAGNFGIICNDSDGIIINCNVVDGTGDDGIHLWADSDNCIVTSNRITNWTNEAIDDDSGTSVVANNDMT